MGPEIPYPQKEHGTRDTYPPGQTNTPENITFPHLRWQSVRRKHSSTARLPIVSCCILGPMSNGVGYHPPPEGTWYQRYPPPERIWDQRYPPPERIWDQRYPPPERIWDQRYPPLVRTWDQRYPSPLPLRNSGSQLSVHTLALTYNHA